MTGLDLSKDHIIELAILITDGQLNVIAEGPELIIHYPKEVMDDMNEWCVNQHGQSGLTAAVLASSVTLSEANEKIMNFVRKFIKTPKIAPLAGNSVHVDKTFLAKEFPDLVEYLHYRIIDVSTVKELTRRWYPQIATNVPKKNPNHRALDDIKDSIKELKFYRENVFIA
ncbi:ribonuclease H-like protein [Basidiobolus meristosporus CBS 931.73]|uniref:Ribonuclease H-like protein n=1 Tax=Basidiobolus meristosporus CBS 931.73 TaxID=1314790 RepID=A0A1Y1X5K0_9FUNG|nr:ribonuclease H-like protein [Basidiobolus meristosporus CBS 931.73]|eukprot:ORX81100.1 ribonuclease H-like protein [Basidiobolus meristosporus CBS 931.73]